jgi:hypothetical protein
MPGRPRRVYVIPSIIKNVEILEPLPEPPAEPREAKPKYRIRITENAILKFE